MKVRITALLLVIILVFSGCGANTVVFDKEKTNIVCAMFSEYDWTRNIVGNTENVNIYYLINNGTDSHSYQPTARDIALITDCDLFIYGGGESEAWIDDVLSTQNCNPDMKVINMMEYLEDYIFEEEIVEGMQNKESESEEETEYDEHIWLSLRNAEKVCEKICDEISDILPSKGAYFYKNTKEYMDELSMLDSAYTDTIRTASKDTILIADRFPFRYLVEDYGLNYYAAFSGCNADAEASFETIVFLSNVAEELGINNILVLEKSDDKLAKAVINTAKMGNCNILKLDSLQSVNRKDAEKKTYLNAMKENRRVLEIALN